MPPDAFWLRLTNFASYLNKRLLLNVEPYSRRDAKAVQLEDFFPGILDQGRVRGGLYGLPADGGGPVLFYNVEQFDRAGVPSPGAQQDSGTWTVDAFLDAGKRLTKRSPGSEVWGAQDPLFHNSVWLAWVWAWGGDFLTRDGQQVALDAGPAVDALQWQQDLITRHGVVPTSAELEQLKEREPNDRRAMFRTGRASMISDWTTTVGAARLKEAEGQGLRWDATLLPAGKSGQFSVSFFHELAIAGSSKAPELAWQWAAFQTGPEGTLRRSLAGATQPHRLGGHEPGVPAHPAAGVRQEHGPGGGAFPAVPPGGGGRAAAADPGRGDQAAAGRGAVGQGRGRGDQAALRPAAAHLDLRVPDTVGGEKKVASWGQSPQPPGARRRETMAGSADLRLPDELRTALHEHLATLRQGYDRRGWGRPSGYGARPAVIVIDLAMGWTDARYSLGTDLDSVVESTARVLDAAGPRASPSSSPP